MVVFDWIITIGKLRAIRRRFAVSVTCSPKTKITLSPRHKHCRNTKTCRFLCPISTSTGITKILTSSSGFDMLLTNNATEDGGLGEFVDMHERLTQISTHHVTSCQESSVKASFLRHSKNQT